MIRITHILWMLCPLDSGLTCLSSHVKFDANLSTWSFYKNIFWLGLDDQASWTSYKCCQAISPKHMALVVTGPGLSWTGSIEPKRHQNNHDPQELSKKSSSILRGRNKGLLREFTQFSKFHASNSKRMISLGIS
ncbi:unnamed protein product [Nesidiocoris tenuis]|uniref:Uncharacterized protein n=1 Tax=Nesidiocoris tenuis TaxID=355587 RepID=A0A6H5FW61_9HEMI|nr:unnamed protein product [Nesidiocoris tenuis]